MYSFSSKGKRINNPFKLTQILFSTEAFLSTYPQWLPHQIYDPIRTNASGLQLFVQSKGRQPSSHELGPTPVN